MSHFVAYLIHTIPLLLMAIIINPMEIIWAIRHPFEVMTSEYETKTAKVSFVLHPLKVIALLALLFGLFICQGISRARVGFHLGNWQLDLAIGITAGVLMIGLQMLLRWLMARAKYTIPDDQESKQLSKDSVPLWIASLLLGLLQKRLGLCFAFSP